MSHSGHSGQAINYLQVVTNVMKSTVFYYVTIVLLGAPLFSWVNIIQFKFIFYHIN